MKQNQSIEIIRVANGYMVRELPNVNSDGMASIQDSWFVFQSFSELTGWLRCHFDYRSDVIKSDI